MLFKIRLYEPTCQRGNINKITSEWHQRRKRVQNCTAWNPSTRLLGHSNAHRSWKSQKIIMGKSMLRQNKSQQEQQAKQHSDRWESESQLHNLTPPSGNTVHQQDETSIWQNGICISDVRSLPYQVGCWIWRSLNHCPLTQNWHRWSPEKIYSPWKLQILRTM
jgi:hypothetical protein